MELKNVVQVLLDSEEYKGLFEPSAKTEWLPEEVNNLACDGVNFFHSAACFPYYRFNVNHEDLKDLLKALYDHVVLTLSQEVSSDIGKYYIEQMNDEQWEINHDINTTWGVDCYDELKQVKESIDKLENDIYKKLCLARKGLI